MTPELRRKLYPLRRSKDAEKRRSLLASLRGADWSDRERLPSRAFTDALRAVLSGISGASHREEKILETAWSEIVGATLAAHCHPASLKKGRLLVLVNHSTWLHLIALEHKRAILTAISRRFPELGVSEIHFRLG
ncbi:MAG: DUF721 domain-containing protein [Verrucomicrobiae bacterium]|nr:DUF721 domain-containing protein [Verrucomicrobiae bacterium]